MGLTVFEHFNFDSKQMFDSEFVTSTNENHLISQKIFSISDKLNIGNPV